MKAQIVDKYKSKYIHCLITLVIMTFFGMIPAPEPITPYGMKILGIFIGAIYALSAVDVLWGALVAIIGLGIAAGDVAGVLASALGSPLIWGILIMQVILMALQQECVTKFIAEWIISRKVLKGRPWLFSFALQMGVFVLAIVNPIAAALLFWEIIGTICDEVKIERTSPWGMLMTFMTCATAGLAVVSLPVINNGLVISNQYAAVTGTPLNGIQYLLAALPLCIACVLLILLVSKFFFKIDVSAIANMDSSITDKGTLKLSGRQKGLLITFIAIIICLLIPSILPKSWAPVGLLANLGIFGIAGIAALVLCILHVDGKPLMDFQSAASGGIRWAPIFMTGIVVPVSGFLTAQETGIMDFVRNILTPILKGKSPYIFAVIVVLVGVVLTNAAQNLIVVSLLLPIVYAMSETFDINLAAVTVLITMATHAAWLLPSAAPVAGLLHANKDVEKSFIFKKGSIFLVLCTLFIMTIGYVWTNFVFNF